MINWKLRLQNKATLTAIIANVLAIIYYIVGIVETHDLSSETISHVCELAVELLVLLGIVVDPTTKGISDSSKAMTYDEPKEY